MWTILCDTPLLVGARVALQAKQFALCFLVGAIFSLSGLLRLVGRGKADKFVCDFLYCLILGVGLLFCAEHVLGGKCELFGMGAFALGVLAFGKIGKIAMQKLKNFARKPKIDGSRKKSSAKKSKA